MWGDYGSNCRRRPESNGIITNPQIADLLPGKVLLDCDRKGSNDRPREEDRASLSDIKNCDELAVDDRHPYVCDDS